MGRWPAARPCCRRPRRRRLCSLHTAHLGHHPLLGASEGGGARSIGVSSQLSHLHDCRTAMEAGEASVQSLSAGKRRRTPDEVRPSGGDALSCLRLALPPSSCIPPLGRVLYLPVDLDLASESWTSSPGRSMAVVTVSVCRVYPRMVPTSLNVNTVRATAPIARSDR